MTSSSAPGRTDGRTARWAGQRERRRREFVEAALRAIAEHGPDASVERIAEEAHVARTGLYKYFADASDLHSAIADRAAELIAAELAPVWNPQGTPMQMIRSGIGAHIGWLADHVHLYRYLTMHSLSAHLGQQDAITDVKTAIGRHLTHLFAHYLRTYELDTRVAEPVAFAVVGLVESSTTQWLENPHDMEREALADLLTRWVWRLLDDTLQAGGAALDPHEPLATPKLTAPSPVSRDPEDAGNA
ncbi:TetR/AcrR family transcriptional regulator [Parasphingorhabdus pacifica]